MNIQVGSGMLPLENLKFRSSKTAGKAPRVSHLPAQAREERRGSPLSLGREDERPWERGCKTCIFLILSLSMGMHPYSGIKSRVVKGARG